MRWIECDRCGVKNATQGLAGEQYGTVIIRQGIGGTPVGAVNELCGPCLDTIRAALNSSTDYAAEWERAVALLVAAGVIMRGNNLPVAVAELIRIRDELTDQRRALEDTLADNVGEIVKEKELPTL